MKALSLRARISLWTAGATSGALLILAVSTVTYIYLEDLEAIDAHLHGELLELSADLATGEVDNDEFAGDEFEPWLELGMFSLAGDLIVATPRFPLELEVATGPKAAFYFHQAIETRWRVYSLVAHEKILVIALDLTEFDDVQDDLIAAQILFVPLVSALTAWLSWIIAGRALSPIRKATLTAAKIGSGDLSNRLPIGGVDDEIGQFTQVLNDMLARIEKSYNQARQFAGDASHELSTPLTIIKGEIERILEYSQLPALTEQRLLSVSQEVDRMNQIIDQLLLLARFDAGKASHEFTTIDLSQMLRDMAEDIALLSVDRRIQIHANIETDLRVRGDANHLRRLLLNLFTNAVKYGEEAGSIVYRLRQSNQRIFFEISNSGAPIPTADREAIFDRFFQSDQSHHQKGSGLGLSLCREIARAHGGEIQLSPSPDFANRFVVDLPLAKSTVS